MSTANPSIDELREASAAKLRQVVRAGNWSGHTSGLSRGSVQANLVILPADAAEEFAAFCRLNPRPCPLIEQTAPGDAEPKRTAPGADLRRDVPRYRVFRHGKPEPTEPLEVTSLWRNDFVSFLLGCSFTFENALAAAGLPVRHVVDGCNVPMYRTNIACKSAGRFAGPMVVSMRPYPRHSVDRVIEITSRFPTMHGGPIHVGDPAALGINDLAKPDFGDRVRIEPDEVPLFWACGVTPQVALVESGCELAITHSPGCMFVTDLRDSDQEVSPTSG